MLKDLREKLPAEIVKKITGFWYEKVLDPMVENKDIPIKLIVEKNASLTAMLASSKPRDGDTVMVMYLSPQGCITAHRLGRFTGG